MIYLQAERHVFRLEHIIYNLPQDCNKLLFHDATVTPQHGLNPQPEHNLSESTLQSAPPC